jgi:hypothetical protein
MVEIKVHDRWTNEEYIENNYEHLYATLKNLGDIAVERLDLFVYDKDAIKKEFLQWAMNEVAHTLNICDDDVNEKVFKYFYHTVPVIVDNHYIYRQKKRNLNELRKLAGIKITRSKKRKVTIF